MALLLDEAVAETAPEVQYHVFGTDVREEYLASAREAVYGGDALGNVRLRVLSRGFEAAGASYGIADRIRSHVEFSAHDLTAGDTPFPPASIYGGFDLVLCCNVLLYYRAEAQAAILDRLRRSLAPTGLLVTSSEEREVAARTAGLATVAPQSSVFRRADGKVLP